MAFSRAHILISVYLWEPRKFPMITHKVYTFKRLAVIEAYEFKQLLLFKFSFRF